MEDEKKVEEVETPPEETPTETPEAEAVSVA